MSYAIVAGQDFPSLPDCYRVEKRAFPASSVDGHANLSGEKFSAAEDQMVHAYGYPAWVLVSIRITNICAEPVTVSFWPWVG